MNIYVKPVQRPGPVGYWLQWEIDGVTHDDLRIGELIDLHEKTGDLLAKLARQGYDARNSKQ